VSLGANTTAATVAAASPNALDAPSVSSYLANNFATQFVRSRRSTNGACRNRSHIGFPSSILKRRVIGSVPSNPTNEPKTCLRYSE
jgi:hypothetical protein